MSLAQDFHPRTEPRTDRYGKPRLYVSPGQPRKTLMKLAVWLDENGQTREWLCEQLGVSASTVDKWCNGRIIPRPERIAKIEELTAGQVTLQDWLKTDK